jgi:hypothetical protein
MVDLVLDGPSALGRLHRLSAEVPVDYGTDPQEFHSQREVVTVHPLHNWDLSLPKVASDYRDHPNHTSRS